MKKALIVLTVLAVVAGIAYAHGGILVRPKSFEFYDKAGMVTVQISADNELTVRLNTFELGRRNNFCELK